MAEYVTKKENTRRMAIIIVCVLLDAVALTIGVLAWKKTNDLQKPENPDRLEVLMEQAQEQRRAVLKLEENLVEFAQPIGWHTVASGTAERFPRGTLNHGQLKNFLSDWSVELKKYGVDKYSRWDEEGGEKLHLTQLLDELAAKEKEYQGRIATLKDQIKAEIEREKEIVTQTEADQKAVIDQLVGPVEPSQPAQGAVGQLIQLLREFNTLQKSHAEELAVSEKETVEKMGEVTKLKNENLRKKSSFEGSKTALQTRINTIQFKREEAKERREEDGEILAVDLDRKVCFINLLHKDRLFKGTRFHVYSVKKGGVKVDKGQVEVIEVRKEVGSIAAIVETLDPEWQLEAGDKIYNEFYEGGKSRYIAFAGHFAGKLSNEEAANLIRKFGDHYQDRVDDRTNYVVVAPGYENHPNYKAAKEFGVKILIEKYLYEYLGVPK